MALSSPSSTHYAANTSEAKQHTTALVILTSLFFLWGFITSLNDILIPHLRGVFSLSYTQAMLVQFCFFLAYFVCSVPAGALVKRVGYQKGIVIGLLIAAAGCLLFVPAASIEKYWLFLIALFVLASGITLLQVSANPFVTLLGKPETAPVRLNLTQGFNALGTTVAPTIGASVILVGGAAAMGAETVKLPYLLLAATLTLLALFFSIKRLPVIEQDNKVATGSLWQHRHLILGIGAIFMYVGAEVAIGSLLINFFHLEHIAGLEEEQAAIYVSYYWGGAMVGRFIGVAIMQKVSPDKLLATNASISIGLLAYAVFASGFSAGYALVAVGLFNSIMFPTIFSLALSGLGHNTSRASGLLCLAIVGGAVIPLFQGAIADFSNLQLSFLVPVACYLFITFYGLRYRALLKSN